MAPALSWLPVNPEWDQELGPMSTAQADQDRWTTLCRLANSRIDFVQTARLDRVAQRLYPTGSGSPNVPSIRLALLGSSTLKHLAPGIRVAGLRRRMWIDVYESAYGQYLQELMDRDSPLYRFRPNCVCLALDAHHLAMMQQDGLGSALELLRSCWQAAQDAFHCTVIQQTAIPVFPDAFGSNEHRMPDSPQTFLRQLNTAMAVSADEAGVHLLSIDKYAASDGIRTWHDPGLWHRSKQEVHPAVSQMYGEYLVRLVAAQRGLSSKCLVLDLDNTLWGGVIGDDGLHGVLLGQGSAAGEAHLAFQQYAKRLQKRGVLLAVCSKNDEAIALEAFEKHAEMLLRREDFACFVANWQDKANNLRQIAKTLSVGLDALVLADDNPFERNLVRQELPEVAVPELPEDPAYYAACLADAGYFEGVVLTEEDRARNSQYQANAARETLRGSVTDMAGYLRGLHMELLWKPFDEPGLQRIVQLINKTNQFNLTTRRYSEADVLEMMRDPMMLTFQMRLKDKLGDNGMIAVLIGRTTADQRLVLDSWLMSCRVLGRRVEEACLNIVAAEAAKRGIWWIEGEYLPTAKNQMVANLYPNLGFQLRNSGRDGSSVWELDLEMYRETETPLAILKDENAGTRDLQPAH